MNSLQEIARLIFNLDTDVIGYRLIVTVLHFGGQVTRQTLKLLEICLLFYFFICWNIACQGISTADVGIL